MRYVITSTQLNYFRKESHITLENFLGDQEASQLLHLLEEAKSHIASGRDLERENPPLKKAIPFSRLGQAAIGGRAVMHGANSRAAASTRRQVRNSVSRATCVIRAPS